MSTRLAVRDDLEREVRAAHNDVRNSLSTRLHHPTYGVTKASLYAKLYRLEGLLIAHRVMFDPDCPPNPVALVGPYAFETFDIPLHTLHDEIKES